MRSAEMVIESQISSDECLPMKTVEVLGTFYIALVSAMRETVAWLLKNSDVSLVKVQIHSQKIPHYRHCTETILISISLYCISKLYQNAHAFKSTGRLHVCVK